MAPLIKLEDVTVEYDGHTALSGVNLGLISKSIAVIGANGSGKSTFVRLLNGLVKPTSGTVSVHGEKPNVSQVGFVFSNPDLQIVMPTVFEDVAFSLRSSKLSKDEVRAKVLTTLKRFGLQDLADEPAHSLSSGGSRNSRRMRPAKSSIWAVVMRGMP